MPQRSLGLEFRRPVDVLSGRQWFSSVACALLVAAGWSLIMHSLWVGATSAVLAILPLWWTPSASETIANRFRFALLVGALMAAIQLGVAVLGG